LAGSRVTSLWRVGRGNPSAAKPAPEGCGRSGAVLMRSAPGRGGGCGVSALPHYWRRSQLELGGTSCNRQQIAEELPGGAKAPFPDDGADTGIRSTIDDICTQPSVHASAGIPRRAQPFSGQVAVARPSAPNAMGRDGQSRSPAAFVRLLGSQPSHPASCNRQQITIQRAAATVSRRPRVARSKLLT
jgi:hypothetical protein